MLVRTILTQKFASTLMQSGQSRPILRGHPDDYPDKNAAPGLWFRMSCLCGRTVRAKVRGFKCIVFFPFLVYIYVNNGAKFRMFTYSEKFGVQIFLEP